MGYIQPVFVLKKPVQLIVFSLVLFHQGGEHHCNWSLSLAKSKTCIFITV